MSEEKKPRRGRYRVKAHALPTPLYQIVETGTDAPVNPLFFYLRREEAEERIRCWELDA